MFTRGAFLVLTVGAVTVSIACSNTSEIESQVAALEARVSELESESTGLRSDLDALESDLASATSRLSSALSRVSQLERDARDDVYSLIDEPEFAIFRIASHLALLALLNNFGGYQTTTSAAGKACIGFYLTGAGSPTDCGFQRVD